MQLCYRLNLRWKHLTHRKAVNGGCVSIYLPNRNNHICFTRAHWWLLTKQGSAKPPVLQIKFSPNTALPMHLHTAQGYFHAATAELSSRNGELLGGKAENIYYLALHRRSLSTPVWIMRKDRAYGGHLPYPHASHMSHRYKRPHRWSWGWSPERWQVTWHQPSGMVTWFYLVLPCWAQPFLSFYFWVNCIVFWIIFPAFLNVLHDVFSDTVKHLSIQ